LVFDLLSEDAEHHRSAQQGRRQFLDSQLGAAAIAATPVVMARAAEPAGSFKIEAVGITLPEDMPFLRQPEPTP
jgi:hypothetical protein